MMTSIKKLALFVFLAFFPMITFADTVILQTGEILEVETSWLSRDQVYFSINGLKLSIPKRYVKRIEGSPPGANSLLARRVSDDVASDGMKTNSTGRKAEPLPSYQAAHRPGRFITDEQPPPGNAFRGLSWGDRLADILGMQAMETDTGLDGVRECVRPSDALTLGQAQLSSIVYAFWHEQLYTISIWTQGLSNYTALRKELFERYGDQMLARKPQEACFWSTGPTDMMLQYLDQGDFGLFWMRSRELDQKLKGSTLNHELAYLKWMRSMDFKNRPKAAQTTGLHSYPSPAGK